MNPRVYDISLATGLILVGVGVACWSVPAALVVAGALVIVLTLAGRWMSRGRTD